MSSIHGSVHAAPTAFSATKWISERLLRLERWRNSLVKKQVKIGAFQVVYLEAGQGPSVVLVHGFGGDKDNWLYFANRLSRHYRVIAIDLPGFGESCRINGHSYQAETQAARIEELRKILQLGPIHIAGNSMGGLIAAVYAETFPEHTRSLTLLDSAGITTPTVNAFMQCINAGQNPLLVSRPEDMLTLFSYNFVKNPWIPAVVRKQMYRSMVHNRHWNDRLFREIFAEAYSVEDILARLPMPILVVWGREDKVLDVSATAVIQSKRPDAEIHILEQCGHLPMVEKAGETSSIFLKFAAQKNLSRGQERKTANPSILAGSIQ